MTTVIQLLDHAIKAAGDIGKLKDPIPSLLIKARGRIEFLEAQAKDVETIRDRIALKLLPGVIERWDADDVGGLAIAHAYNLADQVLAFRSGETQDAEGHFRVGEKVRVRSTGNEGVVDQDNEDCTDPTYTMVNFRGPGGTPAVCRTADLERVQP